MFLIDFQHVPMFPINSHHVLNWFSACSQVPNAFLKMLPIAHHILCHNFCPKLKKLYIGGPKGGMSTNMFWECRLLLWVGVVQTSKFHIFCFFKSRKKFRFFWEIIWDASHNYLIELTISDLSWFQWLDIGGFTMEPIL
jgi:hypothetical protein